MLNGLKIPFLALVSRMGQIGIFEVWDRNFLSSMMKSPLFLQGGLMICLTLDLNSPGNFDIETIKISFRCLRQSYANDRRLVRRDVRFCDHR